MYRVYMYAYIKIMYVCEYVYVFVCVYTHTTYIFTYINIHRHIYTISLALLFSPSCTSFFFASQKGSWNKITSHPPSHRPFLPLRHPPLLRYLLLHRCHLHQSLVCRPVAVRVYACVCVRARVHVFPCACVCVRACSQTGRRLVWACRV